MEKTLHECMFLNEHGDINVSWGEEDHEEMKKLIEKKIDEGYVFFVVEKKFLGLCSTTSKLTKDNVSKKLGKEIVVKDKDLEIFIKQSQNARVNQGESQDGGQYQVKSGVKKKDLGVKGFFEKSRSMVSIRQPKAG